MIEGTSVALCSVITLAVKMLNVVSMEWAVCSIICHELVGSRLCLVRGQELLLLEKDFVLKGLPTVFWVLDDCYDLSEYLQKHYYDRGECPSGWLIWNSLVVPSPVWMGLANRCWHACVWIWHHQTQRRPYELVFIHPSQGGRISCWWDGSHSNNQWGDIRRSFSTFTCPASSSSEQGLSALPQSISTAHKTNSKPLLEYWVKEWVNWLEKCSVVSTKSLGLGSCSSHSTTVPFHMHKVWCLVGRWES